jgi:hypothetical protein
MKFF